MPDSLETALGSAVRRRSALGGGSINAAERLLLDDGRTVFAKSRPGAGRNEFAAEAAGLRWLGDAPGPPVPGVLGFGSGPPFLALAWIPPGILTPEGAERFGRALAELHLSGAPAHGALPPGAPDGLLRIGPIELRSPEREDWGSAYAEDRLLPLLRIAADGGAIGPEGAAAVERVCERIGELGGPSEPPSRLHGDLWSGNVLADEDGEGWLIDPAAHGGHREVDLAMLRLFGVPSPRILAAYEERWPLPQGHAERVELWQLFPLLVHAALFGGSYGASAARIAAAYA